jgi:Transcriptional regulators of sugar metabolism
LEGIKIEFLPNGETKKTRDNVKGHLLEKLVGQYLSSSGYKDVLLNKKVEGTEWDVIGKAALSHAPVIVSCKCLSTSISPEPLKAIGFDVHNLSYDKPTVSGVLIAIPRISSDSITYWNSIHQNLRDRIRIVEESDLVKELCEKGFWLSPSTIKAIVKRTFNCNMGDTRLLYTEIGAFWVQFIIDQSNRTPTSYTMLSAKGENLTDEEIHILNDLLEINNSDIREFNRIDVSVTQTISHSEEQLAHITVSGRGWFDYKYPAPSEYFAGRENPVEDFINYVLSVLSGKTASRVAIVTGVSGIGKSSLLFKFKERTSSIGGELISINCVSAKGKTFLLQVILKMLKELEKNKDCSNIVNGVKLRGMDSLPQLLFEVLENLKEIGVTPILFFDQFETALLDGPLSETVVDFVLAMEELKANIIIGFAWKTDLWWPDDHVPYSAREQIRKSAYTMYLDQFGPSETNVLLKALSKEINQSLDPKLQNEIRLFTRGYPWLLKKVCWHIVEQINRGITQNEIMDRKLDLRALFETDLEQLDEDEKIMLKKLAGLLPADGRTIGEAFSEKNIHDLLNRFVSLRLLLKQGETYNIYHDIFKEFLRTGRVPIEESYLLKVSPLKSLEIIQFLINEGNSTVDDLASKLKVKATSIYNYMKSLSSLGLINSKKGTVLIAKEIEHIQTKEELIVEVRRRLLRNTCVREILKLIGENETINEEDVVNIIKKEFPSLPFKESTWIIYARILIQWLNHVKAFGKKSIVLKGAITSRKLVGSESIAQYPQARIHGVIRLVNLLYGYDKLNKNEISNFLGIATKSVEKGLVDTRLLGFVERLLDGGWRLTTLGRRFFSEAESSKRLIVSGQLEKIPIFIEIEEAIRKEPDVSMEQIVRSLLIKRGKNLIPSTVQTITLCIMNWHEYAHDSLLF